MRLANVNRLCGNIRHYEYRVRWEKGGSCMKIVVLAGGISTERDVSLITGKMIYQALKGNGHAAVLLDVYLGYEGDDCNAIFEKEEDWSKAIGAISENNPDIAQIKALRPDGDKNFFGPNVIRICQEADIVFMALHGENGENGKIQAAFDLMGIRYTGTDYVSSALAMDKALTKELFLQNGVSTPQGTAVSKADIVKPCPIPFPCVVKTCCGGSSIGVYIVETQEAYVDAMKEAFSFGDQVIVEEYIKGREFSGGVIEGKALPIIEIAPLQGFYDYKNKYQAGSTIETCPADISEELTKKMQQAAEKAYEVLRMKTYARMDFMMRENGEMFCLEANTLPGMTPTSLIPQEAAAEGISFPELCEKLIRISMKKYE